MDSLIAFLKDNQTTIFTLLGIIITQLLSRWNIGKQVAQQHKATVEREWSTNVRVVVSELLRYVDDKHKTVTIFANNGETEKAIQDNLSKLELLLNFTRESHYTLFQTIEKLTKVVDEKEYPKIRKDVVGKFQKIFYSDFSQ